MMLIYSPSRLSQAQEEELDAALRRDRARIHYQGNDGADEYVIVEANDFTHTQQVGRSLGVSLALTQRSEPIPEKPRREARQPRRRPSGTDGQPARAKRSSSERP